jgi:hypothetical protein
MPTPSFDVFTFKFAFEFYKEFEGEQLKIGIPATLKAHNFLCILLIEVRSKAKL